MFLPLPQNDESRIVRLYQYLGWPEDGLPGFAANLLNLRSMVRSTKDDSVSSAKDERRTIVMCRYDIELHITTGRYITEL